MKTKYISLTLAILFISTVFVFSQDTSKPVFGIQGGLNLQNLTGKDAGGDELDNSIAPGFHAGVNVLLPIAPDMYFQPGLLFSRKGAKNSEGQDQVNFNISYLELPLNLLYRAQLGNGKVLLGFGPYLGYAVKGKVKSDDDEMDIEFKNTIESGDPIMTMFLKAFDAGANIYAGYETALGIYLQLNTQLGLLKINPKDNRSAAADKSSLKNTGFGISIGYRF